MDKQLSLSALSDELSHVLTKKREFLDEIERTVPWEKWVSIIKPYYYKGESILYKICIISQIWQRLQR